MSNREEIIQAIYRAVDEINSALPIDQRLESAPETVLVGSEATLDSLGLINLIVATEQQLTDLFGRSLDLTTAALLNPEEQLSTLDRLAQTIESLLSEATNG